MPKNYHESIPSRYLLAQRPQWKHLNNVWNLFKINNKDVIDAVLVSFLLTLNEFHMLHWLGYKSILYPLLVVPFQSISQKSLVKLNFN